jgi:hypothetical protein
MEAVPVIAPGTTGVPGLTVTVTGLLVALDGLAQTALDKISKVTTCPLVNALCVKEEPVPALLPSIFHW